MNDMTLIDQSALARLREKAAMNADIQVWKPEPGETLEGAIVGSRKAAGLLGEQWQALVQTPEGPVVAVWLSPWLLGQLRTQDAARGDLLSLTFHEKVQRQHGSYNRISVTVLKTDEG